MNNRSESNICGSSARLTKTQEADAAVPTPMPMPTISQLVAIQGDKLDELGKLLSQLYEILRPVVKDGDPGNSRDLVDISNTCQLAESISANTREIDRCIEGVSYTLGRIQL